MKHVKCYIVLCKWQNCDLNKILLWYFNQSVHVVRTKVARNVCTILEKKFNRRRNDVGRRHDRSEWNVMRMTLNKLQFESCPISTFYTGVLNFMDPIIKILFWSDNRFRFLSTTVLIMELELVSETLACMNQITRLCLWEDSIVITHHKSFKINIIHGPCYWHDGVRYVNFGLRLSKYLGPVREYFTSTNGTERNKHVQTWIFFLVVRYRTQR
jgi:hypothetical protein